MPARQKKVNPPEPDTKVVNSECLRDDRGLLKGVTYHFKENGMVDWRKMISKEHIVLNKFNFACRGIDVDSLSKGDVERLISESPEEDLVIKLAGFREIANIRGYTSLDSKVEGLTSDKVIIKVTIEWIDNFENNAKPFDLYTVSAIASASLENTDDRFSKYLETIAENRAFVRAVRHSLGIIAVGQDEIKQDDIKIEVPKTKIHSLLLDLMNKLGLNLESLKELIVKEGFEWNEKWISVEKIDPATVISIIPLLKQTIN